MEKKVIFSLLVLLVSMSVVAAAGEKLDISPTKESFSSGEKISFLVSLYDSENNPISDSVKVILEDAEKKRTVEKSVDANAPAEIDLGADAPAGYWKILASYTNANGETVEANSFFVVETSEQVKFELKNSTLTIINVGNTRYTKTIQIVIGDTIGARLVDLDVGERVSFRLIAPSGTYDIKVTDGKTTVNQGGVSLTGKAIGVLDEKPLSRTPMTGEIKSTTESPYGDAEGSSSIFSGSKGFAYIFVLVIFGAAILLVIERKFRKSALSQ